MVMFSPCARALSQIYENLEKESERLLLLFVPNVLSQLYPSCYWPVSVCGKNPQYSPHQTLPAPPPSPSSPSPSCPSGYLTCNTSPCSASQGCRCPPPSFIAFQVCQTQHLVLQWQTLVKERHHKRKCKRNKSSLFWDTPYFKLLV